MNALATLRVQERAGRARSSEPIRIGVPLARGVLTNLGTCSLVDSGGRELPAQCKVTSTWPDGSARWLLVDACVDVGAQRNERFTLHTRPASRVAQQLIVTASAGHVQVDTGAAVFEVAPSTTGSLVSVSLQGTAVLGEDGMRLTASTAAKAPLAVHISDIQVEESGPLRAAVVSTGALVSQGVELARITIRQIYTVGSAALRMECEIWNHRPALHVGGLWDLGDAGSLALGDLSLEIKPVRPATSLEWQAEPGAWAAAEATAFTLYQDSSGGDRWDSPNHLDARGHSTVTFRGWRARGAQAELLAHGDRAMPAVRLATAGTRVLATVEKFWQNFPKALRCRAGTLGIGLLPAECASGFEIQGGEKKRHTVVFDFSVSAESDAMLALHSPLEVSLDPAESAATQAVGHLVPAAEDRNTAYLDYVASMIDGRHSVATKREIIDEYGWRNFGDLYADHEAVNHKGAAPFVSHYNNQYDFIYGAGMQFLRTGDCRWHGLMVEAARHLIDIDVYRTQGDKAGFNGGLFWHTDHYQPAATCTHRTYSRRNANGPYGGGPSNEHNYTSGLLLYYQLTGDSQAADTIRLMAEWVIGMDDGGRTLLGLIDDGPTGLASKTRDNDFHKPGRGAGNSINALLDAFTVTRDRRYLSYAEVLIQRVIHPRDEIGALQLDQPENRWSYLVFLQVLGKYLDRKLEWGETDYLFWYSRASLLAYARWMLQNEHPYKDVLHKVDLPTETWPAHDVRKCHVFHLAARHAPPGERAPFSAKAKIYFERGLGDLLSFPTAYLTRPQVILCTYGVAHGYYENDPHHAEPGPEPQHDFGLPVPFLPQGARLRRSLRRKWSVSMTELRRLLRDRWRAALMRMRK